MSAPARAPVPPDDDDCGLDCWTGTAGAMVRAHRHDGVELNYSRSATLDYLFDGRPVRVPPRTVALFWSSVPHQLVGATPGAPCWWLTVPLVTFVQWGVNDAVLTRLLSGIPLLVPVRSPAQDPVDRLDRWRQDLHGGDGDQQQIAVLEVQAYVRRLSRDPGAPADGPAVPFGTTALQHAAAMARYLTVHFAEPVSVAELAAAVHLHPGYAATLFRQVLGTTPAAYLRQRRVAEAQRLLLASDATVTRIAHAAGFGSVSRFHAVFVDACGCSPGQYRRAHRSAGGPV